MANTKEDAGRLEWRIRVDNGSSEILAAAHESSPANGLVLALKCMIANLFLGVWTFFKKAWHLGTDDPRKLFHCLKVGIALSAVSLFYYMRPLYDGVGGNSMWAVMTVVVVFEYTVGATICKCLNRIIGTCLAGLLAVGIHWIASRSGHRFEPIIMGVSVFLLASAATFSRFIPAVKKRFDYGALVFILTFSLVSVSGYRVEKLFYMARERLSTIIIGTSLCILTSMLVFPVWAGGELHQLIIRNIDKLANSLDGCVTEFFDDSRTTTTDGSEVSTQDLLAYKCVLNSKATEESMANFARWEPPRGSFSFRHPWKQYLKIGASMRNCAYCIEAVTSCINNKQQASKFLKKHLSDICRRVNSSSSCILRELAKSLDTMSKSSKIDISVEEMKSAVQDLKSELKSLPALLIPNKHSETKLPADDKKEPVLITNDIPLVEIVPLVTFASLLIEIASRVEAIVKEVQELAKRAEFKPMPADKPKHTQHENVVLPVEHKDEKTMKTLESV